MVQRTDYVQGESGHAAAHNSANAELNGHIANVTNPHGTTLAKISGAASSVVTLASTLIQWLRIDIPTDASDPATWPDRLAMYFNGSRTGYFNEYGELRSRPHNQAAIAMRTLGHASGSTGDIFQVTDTTGGSIRFRVSETAAAATVPLTAPNFPPSTIVLNAGDAVPGGTPTGSIVFRRP
jgi:hypothetical protein